MADRRRHRPAGNLVVRNLDAVLHLVREPAEAAAEDDADRGLEIGLLPDPADGGVDRAGGHAEPFGEAKLVARDDELHDLDADRP